MRRQTLLGSLLIAVSGCSSMPSLFHDPAPAAATETAAAALAPQPVAETSAAPSSPAPVSAPAPAAPDAVQVLPGQCWVYAQVKPKPVQRTVEVVLKDSVNKITVSPAELRQGYKQVVTREGTKTYRIEPATYKEVSERIEVRPEVKRYEVVPPVYMAQQQQIVVKEGKTELESCGTAGTRYAKSVGVTAFCARQVPAQTKEVQTEVLVEPERVREVIEPAVYETVKRWVVDQPARAVEVDVPPEVEQRQTVEVARQVEASQVIVPEQTERMEVTTFEGQASIVSRQAVCDADLNETLVRDVQMRLSREGYGPGSIDGKLGPRTIAALVSYQEKNGLAIGALTLETLDALGVR